MEGKKLKIGIITITNGENYGNRLQNYAVQEALKDIGAQPETIHKTTNVFNAEGWKYLLKLRFKKFIHYHLTKEEDRRLNFYRFTKKYIKRSRFVIDEKIPEGMEEEYKYFVAGSDQVWNPFLDYCTGANFLDFTKAEKKIAFSASIAVEEIPEEKRDNFKKWIQDFRLLSVREQRGAELIYELCGRHAQVLADPTLYLPCERWRTIEKKIATPENGYVLIYFLGECTEEYRRQIETYAKRKNLDIFELQSDEHYGIAPDEFLYLIDHSELVCTDSFHGTVFSIIFHKAFVVFERREKFANMNSRLVTLLSAFSMESRRSECIKEDHIFTEDFSKADNVIKAEREKISSFLDRIDRGEGCE